VESAPDRDEMSPEVSSQSEATDAPLVDAGAGSTEASSETSTETPGHTDAEEDADTGAGVTTSERGDRATEKGAPQGGGGDTENDDRENTEKRGKTEKAQSEEWVDGVADSDESRMAGTIRIASHVAVWAAVLVPTIAELTRGWRPFGDNAAIASRAHQVFSLHPPLVGMASAASFHTGHVVYDPGPLLFYLLAIPEKLDASQGLLWGAALFGGIALSVAVEAAWSAGRAVGAALVAFAVLDMAWLTPQVFENLPWNAYFPVPFFIASVAAASAVAAGRAGWWPVLVAAASVAAQSHLFFVVPGLVLVLVALAFALIGSSTRASFGWLWSGLVLGALCWLAPIVQQFTDTHGNLTGLLHADQGQRTFGLGPALREVGVAAAPHPVWLTHLPPGFVALIKLETTHGPWYGGLVLGLLVIVAVGAPLTGRRALGALAVVGLAATAAVMVSFAIFPAKNVISVGYLADSLWPLGVLLWAVGLWVVLEIARDVLARVGGEWARRPQRWSSVVAPAASLAVLVVLPIVAVIGLRPIASHPDEVDWSPADVALVARAATAIERAVAPGPVSIVVLSSDFFLGTWSTEGIAYRLETDGWRPGTSGDPAVYTGLAPPPRPPAPAFVIRLHGTSVASVTMTR